MEDSFLGGWGGGGLEEKGYRKKGGRDDWGEGEKRTEEHGEKRGRDI